MNKEHTCELTLVTITGKEYQSLLEDSQQLSYLHSLGVDNWEGYAHYSSDESEEDIYG